MHPLRSPSAVLRGPSAGLLSVQGPTLARHCRAALAVVVACLSLVAVPAAAQETRTEQIQQQRARKATELRLYQRDKVEAVLFEAVDQFRVQRLFNPPRGLFARFGGFPEGAGFPSAGPAYRYSNPTMSLTATTAISARRYWEVDTRLIVPTLAGRRAFVEIGGRHRDFPQEDFFGLGPDSRAATQTSYAVRETSVDALGGLSPVSWLSIAGAVAYLSPRVGRGRDPRFPSTEQLFSESAAPGLRQQPDFGRLGTRVTVDYTDKPIGARSGGRYVVSFDRYLDRHFDRYSFGRWDLDVRQYIPIVSRTRSLALRVRVSSLAPDEGHDVPFYLQPTLGGGYSLRGLRPYRLRDRNLLLLQAEYRWDVNPFLTGAIFYDAGKVAFRRKDLNLDDLNHDFGIGVRFGWLGAVGMRAEIAFGSIEGTRFVFKLSDVF
jgi:hypothetical protein